MLLSAAATFVAFGFALIAVERVFSYPGSGAFGGIVIGLTGTRIIETGLVHKTDCCVTTIDMGGIPIGFLVMIFGALILIISMDRYRRQAV